MELIITAGMVGIMSAAVISLIGTSSRKTARDGRRMADLNSIAAALELYRNDNGGYPLLLSSLTPNYISTVPTDPLASSGRLYPYGPKNVAGVACSGTPANRCVQYAVCAAGEKTTAADAKCSGLSCGAGTTCSLDVSQP